MVSLEEKLKRYDYREANLPRTGVCVVYRAEHSTQEEPARIDIPLRPCPPLEWEPTGLVVDSAESADLALKERRDELHPGRLSWWCAELIADKLRNHFPDAHWSVNSHGVILWKNSDGRYFDLYGACQLPLSDPAVGFVDIVHFLHGDGGRFRTD